MKLFLVKFLKISLAVLIGSVLLSACIFKLTKTTFESNEADGLVCKLNSFKADTDFYNTIFIGTSRTYRHISPAVFDKLTGLKSYNLGYGGLYPFRSYDLINKVLKNTPAYNNIKNIFIELELFDPLKGNFNSNPAKFSITVNKYRIIIGTVLFSSMPVKNKLSYVYYYSLLFFYKYAGFGIMHRIKQHTGLLAPRHLSSAEMNKYAALMNSNKGFLSLDDEQVLLRNNEVTATRKQFLRNPDAILKQFITEYPQKVKYKTTDEFDRYVLNTAESLTQSGKKVYFILPPRLRYFATAYTLKQKEALEKKGFIIFDLSSPRQYPGFYTKENSFDRMHMNERGAMLYSIALSQQYNNMNSK